MKISQIKYKIEKSIDIRGVVGSFLYALKVLKKKVLMIHPTKRKALEKMRQEDFELDKTYGLDTAAIVSTDNFNTDSENLKYATQYQPISWIDFEKLLAPYNINYNTTSFVDLGSGKGRSLFLAASLPFKRIIGVEFDKNLVAIAEKNIQEFKKYNIKAKYIETICQDAAKYQFPETDLLIFMYNPFDKPVMEKVIESVIKFYDQHTNSIMIVYFNPVYGNLWKKQHFLNVLKDESNLQIYATKQS